MKKFKVLKNFTTGGKIYKAGEEFQTRDRQLISNLIEQELVEPLPDADPVPKTPFQQRQQQQQPQGQKPEGQKPEGQPS